MVDRTLDSGSERGLVVGALVAANDRSRRKALGISYDRHHAIRRGRSGELPLRRTVGALAQRRTRLAATGLVRKGALVAAANRACRRDSAGARSAVLLSLHMMNIMRNSSKRVAPPRKRLAGPPRAGRSAESMRVGRSPKVGFPNLPT